MRFVLFWLEMLTFLLGVALFYSTPLVLVILALRKRLHPTVGRALLASSFAAAVAFQIWRMEWFDVWRHGFPGASYLLTAFAPYMIAFGCVGWWIGGLASPRSGDTRKARLVR